MNADEHSSHVDAARCIRRAIAILAAAALLTAIGCGGSERGYSSAEAAEDTSKLTGTVTLTGSSTVAPLASQLGKAFERRHPRVRINVQAGGSGRGIADARTGTADIGMASRTLIGDEKQLNSITIARDGIGLLVHASNPLDRLRRDQAKAIYTDAAQRWSAVGGKDEPITVINKARGRGTRKVFRRYLGVASGEMVADVIGGHNEQVIKTVAGNRSAIGYVSIGAAEAAVKRGAPVKLLTIGGVAATRANVASGEYPISRPLNFVTDGEPTGPAARFVEFARSEAAHEIIRAQYFTPPAE